MTTRPELTADGICAALANTPFAAHADDYRQAMQQHGQRLRHGDAPAWLAAIAALPPVTDARVALDADPVAAHFSAGDETTDQLRSALQQLTPWRKGPWRIGPVDIDTEWRSDWKWQRIVDAMAPLADRMVLDIGGGNGYFALRCVGRGARGVLNVDPTLLFYMQFLAVNRYLDCEGAAMLPLPFEALPATVAFDTALSMGVLYHRRSPLDHLSLIGRHLRPGGELVLETLVVDGDETTLLVPADRYAGMRNVWFLPSVAMLRIWLARCGFGELRLVDESMTTIEEQRSTEWMTFHSLEQALDVSNPGRTIEGHPAPKRAVLIATHER